MRTILLVLALLLSAAPVSALQKRSAAPDGSLSFEASVTGITRVSIKGDRIRKIVNADSGFEMSNDAETGDVFLRHLGGEITSETGYIVTEKGITLAYELNPVKREAEAVLITIEGQDNAGSEGSYPTSSASFADPVAVALTGFVREVIAKRINGKSAPKRANGTTVTTYSNDSFKARVLIARAGKDARRVRQQDFYEDGVLAVWVERPSLAPGEASWVVTVEARSVP